MIGVHYVLLMFACSFIYFCLESEILEMLQCSFVISLIQGYIMVHLIINKFLDLHPGIHFSFCNTAKMFARMQ